MMSQSEFTFAQPYIDAANKRTADYNKFFARFASVFPKDVFKNILNRDVQPMDVGDGPSIPMTLLLGRYNQYEFDFVKPIDSVAWASWNLPIEYAVDTFFDESKVYCCGR